VARAKRTQRADARRRYRAAMAESEADGSASELADDAPAAPAAKSAATPKPASGKAAPAPQTRPSITTAFRESFRPIDLRGDLRALPQLLTHWSFFVPVLLSGAAVASIPIFGLNALTSTFYQYFSYTAPIGSSFIAGFFAPRASYLVGGLAAFASWLFQVIAFNSGAFAGVFAGAKDPVTGAPIDSSVIAAGILSQALVVGVPSGAFFASAAAWYRRFLRRANPNRQASAQSGSGRRPDGKVPKQKQGRPLLARRR
jgi:hypothetical protein